MFTARKFLVVLSAVSMLHVSVAQADLSLFPPAESHCLTFPEFECLVALAHSRVLSMDVGSVRDELVLQLMALYGQAGEIQVAVNLLPFIGSERILTKATEHIMQLLAAHGESEQAYRLADSYSRGREAGFEVVARGLLLAGDIPGAIVALQRMEDDTRIEDSLARISAQLATYGWVEAELAISAILSVPDPPSDATSALVELLLAEDNFIEAVLVMNHGNSGHMAVYSWLIRHGRAQEASRLLEQRSSTDVQFVVSAARYLAQAGQLQEALTLLDHTDQLSPQDIYLEYAEGRVKEGDVEAAVSALQLSEGIGAYRSYLTAAPVIQAFTAAGYREQAQLLAERLPEGGTQTAVRWAFAVGDALAGDDDILGAETLRAVRYYEPGGPLFLFGTPPFLDALAQSGRYMIAIHLVAGDDDLVWSNRRFTETLLNVLLEQQEFELALVLAGLSANEGVSVLQWRGILGTWLAQAGRTTEAKDLVELGIHSDVAGAVHALLDIAAIELNHGDSEGASTTISRALALVVTHSSLGDDATALLAEGSIRAAAILEGYDLINVNWMFGISR